MNADSADYVKRRPRTPNPPIKGHALLNEGHVWRMSDDKWDGGCQCGLRPIMFPDVGVNSMKKWHRWHKAELRGATLSEPHRGSNP